MPCQRRRFQHFVESQIGQVERRSWTRHSLKSSQAERLNCWEQTWNKWISSLKHLKSVPFDFSHFDLSAMVLQEVRTCQLMLANRSCHTIFFIPSKKRRKSCQTAFRRFPIIVPFQILSIAQWQVLADYIGQQPVSSSGTVQVLPPWRSDGRCGPQFPVGKAPGECDPYGGALNLHKFTFKNFLHLFFWICFCSTFQSFFFQGTIVFFATSDLQGAACCSPSGWCGGSPDFCECPGCRRFLKLEERQNAGKTVQDLE